MKAFTPHLWIEIVEQFDTEVQTINGIRGQHICRKVTLPADLTCLEDEGEMIQRVGGFIAEHFQSENLKVTRAAVAHYVYLRESESAYRFTPQGECVERIEKHYERYIRYGGRVLTVRS